MIDGVRRLLHRAPQPPAATEPGLMIVQLDGLSHVHVNEAMDRGLMPNLKRRIESGQLVEEPYHSGLPSQTAVAQGGVLLGQSTMPANQWIVKTEDWRTVNPMGLANPDEVEADLTSKGPGGLLSGGRAYFTPLAGGADRKNSFIALSNLAAVQHEAGQKGLVKEAARELGHLLFNLGQHPIQAARTTAAFAASTATEYKRTRAEHPDQPRMQVLKNSASTAGGLTLALDASVRALQHDMKTGKYPALFVDLTYFDDNNHIHGNNEYSLESLKAADRNLELLLRASEQSPRQYRVVAYGDHGSSPSIHFHQKYGQTFQQFVDSILPSDMPPSLSRSNGEKLPPVITQDFGSGAMIYFTSTTRAMDRKDIAPQILDRLKHHPGIAFVATRDGAATVIEGAEGTVRVEPDKRINVLRGTNPLHQFDNAFIDSDTSTLQIHDMTHRQNQGDIVVFGKQMGDKMLDFSPGGELGLHGGLGNTQESPTLIHAPDAPIDGSVITQGAGLYWQLRGMLPSDSPLQS